MCGPTGVTHGCVLQGARNYSLADLCLEGSDQHRGWFQSSRCRRSRSMARRRTKLLTTASPDAKGMKMSKSKGNTIAPQQVIKTQGADIRACGYGHRLPYRDEYFG